MEEACSLLQGEDPCVVPGPSFFQVTDGEKLLLERPAGEVWGRLRPADSHTCEVFLNGGEQVVSFHFRPAPVTAALL